MKRLLRFLVMALLGLLLSWNLTSVTAQTPALDAYQRGDLALAEQLLKQALTEPQAPLKQAQILAWLALTLQKLGQWPEAETAIAQSLSLVQTLTPTPAQILIHAQILNSKGTLELAKGQAKTALLTWQDAQPRKYPTSSSPTRSRT